MSTDSRPPQLSVIIPAFDAAETLDEQLSAFARQTPQFAFELLLCDNGSRDGTLELARSWPSRLSQLRLIDASARRGPSFARNTGAQTARAPFLAFCDADDVVADDWVERMAAALARSSVVAGSLEVQQLAVPRAASVSWAVDDAIVKQFWPRYPATPSSNLGIRAELFRAIGGFDESLSASEDIDLCWRAQLAGGTFERSEDVVVHLRKRIGLRPVYRQGYSYAVGDVRLQHKYAEYIARDRDVVIPPVPRSTVVDGPAPRRSLVRRMLRVLSPDGRADAAYRVGHWMGRHRGRVDPSAPRLTPESREG